MTIKETKIRLINFFKIHETFCWKNFKDVIPISQNEKLDAKILEAALGELVENKILKKCEVPEEKVIADYWVLVQPLTDYNQTIEISSNTAFGMAVLFNQFCEVKKINDRMNPMEITEKNLQDILFMLNDLMLKTKMIKEEKI